MRRLAALLVLLALALAVTGADAHPLGNFSISHYTALEIGAAEVTVRYVIDMAEIPTFQETQDTGLVAEAGHASVAPWSAKKVAALVRGLRLTIGEQPLSLTAVSHETIFPPGAGGLPTLKLGVVYRAPLPLEGKGGTLQGSPTQRRPTARSSCAIATRISPSAPAGRRSSRDPVPASRLSPARRPQPTGVASCRTIPPIC